MFFHLEEVVGVGEAWVRLQRPHVKHLENILMVNTFFSSKFPCVNEWLHHQQTPSPKYDVKLKRKTFSPSWEMFLACEVGIGLPHHILGLQFFISMI
jgi:hypothetical protein